MASKGYLVTSLFVFLFVFTLLLDQSFTTVRADDKASQAEEILAKARAALGNDTKTQSISSFSLTWKYRKLSGNTSLSGEIKIHALLPDKLLKEDVFDLSIGQVINREVMNGDKATSETQSTSSEIPVTSIGEQDQSAVRRRMQKDYTLTLLQLLLKSSTDFPLEFSYVGEAEAKDGQALVVDASGQDNFAARLFFDKATFRLLLLSYRVPEVKFTISSDNTEKNNTQIPRGAEVEVKLRFSDYKPEDGIILPHLITTEQNGKIVAEKELKSFKLNPTFKQSFFEIKKTR